MSFTLANLKTSLQAHGYGTDTTTAQTTLVNTVLRRLYGLRRWDFLQTRSTAVTLTAGQATQSLAAITDLLRVEAVRLEYGSGDEQPQLQPLAVQEVNDKLHVDRTQDEPMYWAARSNSTLVFWPTPDKAYTVIVDYVKLPTLPSADADAITWPDAYQDVIVYGALESLAFRQRDWNQLAAAKAGYSERLNEMIAQHGITDRQGHSKVEWSAYW